MIPLLRTAAIRVVVIEHDLLVPQDQKEEEEKILDRFRGLCIGEWTEIVIDLHLLLVMDEIGMIFIIIVVKTAVNESGIKIDRDRDGLSNHTPLSLFDDLFEFDLASSCM